MKLLFTMEINYCTTLKTMEHCFNMEKIMELYQKKY